MYNEKRLTNLKIKEFLGKCPCCNTIVYDNQLFVRDGDNIYHFSCHNQVKKEKQNLSP